MKASFLGILIVVLLIGCQSEVAEPIVVTRIVTEQVSITATPELVAVTRSITATPLPTATMEPTPTMEPTVERPLITNFVSLEGHTDRVNSIEFSPDGRLLLTASDDGTAILWNMDGTIVQTLIGHTDIVSYAGFSPDGSQIITTSYDKTAQLWDIEGNLIQLLDGHAARVNSALFSPDGHLIVTAAREPRIWDRDGNLLAELDGHRSLAVLLAISQDSRYLIAASGDTTTDIWELDEQGNATFYAELDGQKTGMVEYIAFLPDQRRFITSEHGDMLLWEITESGNVNDLTDRSPYFDLISYRPFVDDFYLIFKQGYDRIGILNFENQNDPIMFDDHPTEVLSAETNHDGSLLLTTLRDHTAMLWDIDGRLLGILEGHQYPIRHVVFNPKGKYVVTAPADGEMRIWDISDR